jgi:hypothetical protein
MNTDLDAVITTPQDALSYLHLVHAALMHAKQETTVIDAALDIVDHLMTYIQTLDQ